MRLINVVFTVCCLLSLQIPMAKAATAHTLKGLVITPEGTVVPKFSVVVKHVSEKPELVRRWQFKDGEFTADGLPKGKYQVQISAPQFISTKLIFDFNDPSRETDYSIIILHPYRNEARLTPGAAYSVSLKVLQQKIPDAAQQAYKKGVELHREGKLEDALIQYGQALRSYPQYLEALTDIGTILLLYNRPEAALSYLRRAQAIDDTNPIINLNIAVALTEQADYGGALKLLKEVLHREPHMAFAQYFVAKIQYLQKKYDQAELNVREAIENDPGLLDALVLMINISIEQKNFDQAREALQRIREAMHNQMVTKFIDEQLSVFGS
jgi:tetratricopeptide (TPR) repeat protein